MDRRSLVEACQSSFIVFALVGIISFDMTYMMSGELVNSPFDFRQSTLLSHFQGGKVGVGAGSVPISLQKTTFISKAEPIY